MSETDTNSSTLKTQTQVADLPWVTYCGEICDGGPTTEHTEATHRIEMNTTKLRWATEIHTLQNLGVEIVSVSGLPDMTPRLYVKLPKTRQ